MDAPPQTIALAGLILLNFVLAAAGLCLQFLGRRRPRQQVPPPPPPLLESAVAGEAAAEEGGAGGGERPQNQRRRRRARRKRQQQEGEEGTAAAAEGGGHGADGDRDAAAKAAAAGKEALLPRRPQFPLASVAGALQRRINARYDDIARASETQCLTIEQVNEFVNCLIDARNELLQRYENVQRSFKIKKAMLSNHRNYRSSYERLFEQVRRLETERDNLKKDADIYNYIQERLQKSEPYKIFMELSATDMEPQPHEISFEELLAKEKEDTAFWQRNGKLRSFSSK